MRFLSPVECSTWFVGTRFVLGPDGRPKIFEPVARQQNRLSSGAPGDVSRLAACCESLIRWLPEFTSRMLWIIDAPRGLNSARAGLNAVRRGVGEMRPLEDTPFHCTSRHSWTWDQLEISPDQSEDEELLVTLISLVMGCGWDGWLLADASLDAIEFWEGNVLFYSDNKQKIDDAHQIMQSHHAHSQMS